ncbi:MAG: phosphatidate cytidylyltransferase [Pelobium sp.]
MKKLTLFTPILLLTVLLSSCSAIEGIFKAGFYSAIFVIVLIVFIVGFIIYKFKN